jgi:hypothetical protein
MASVLDRIRAWWSPAKLDPDKPHAYQSIDSVAAAAVAGGTDQVGGESIAPVMILARDATTGRCRVYGCNRPADDPIHQ